MGKPEKAECTNQWRIAAPDFQPRHPFLSCLDLTCCPCAGYARVSNHIRSHADGVPIVITKEDGFFTRSCFGFLGCLPCYSCLIAKLQNRFRHVYNLKGNYCTDYMDACCCPAGTVTRMEIEAIVRQKEHQILKSTPSALGESGSGGGNVDGYQNSSPMIYPKPIGNYVNIKHPEPAPKSKDDRFKSAFRRRKENSEHDVAVLDTIPEGSPEPSITAPVFSPWPLIDESPLSKISKRHPWQDGATMNASTRTKPWPLFEYLGQK